MQSLELTKPALEIATDGSYTVCVWPDCQTRYATSPHWQITPEISAADAIVVTDVRSLHVLAEQLREEQKFLLPVIGLSDDKSGWLDHARLPGLAAALEHAQDILRQIELIDHLALNESTLLLARMFTRAADLHATCNAGSSTMITYPLAGLLTDIRERAEELAGRGFLAKRFFDRLHVCPQCQSSRLNVREECSSCRSPRIEEQPIVHHFRCGHEATESEYKQAGPHFECPKCGDRLRHIGLDYDKPGSAMVCRACGQMDDTVAIGFRCMDCHYHQDSERMPTRTWYHYSLTAKGREALFRGDLAAWSTALVSGEFRTLIQQALREADTFATAFQVLRLQTASSPTSKDLHDRLRDQTHNLMIDCVRRVLRPVDMVVDERQTILAYLPRSSVADAEETIQQIRQQFTEVLRYAPEAQFEILQREQICALAAEGDPWTH